MILIFDLLSKLKMQISKNGCADNEGVLSDKIERFYFATKVLRLEEKKLFLV
jgi:hypothetical protein